MSWIRTTTSSERPRSLRPFPRPRSVLGLLMTVVVIACGQSVAPTASSPPTPGATGGSSNVPSMSSHPSDEPSTSSGNDSTAVSISIVDFGFDPGSIQIKRGTEVTWTNYGSIAFSGLVMGNADHTVTFGDLGVGSADLDHMQSYSLYFDKAGTYNYVCRIHDSMHGTVIVLP